MLFYFIFTSLCLSFTHTVIHSHIPPIPSLPGSNRNPFWHCRVDKDTDRANVAHLSNLGSNSNPFWHCRVDKGTDRAIAAHLSAYISLIEHWGPRVWKSDGEGEKRRDRRRWRWGDNYVKMREGDTQRRWEEGRVGGGVCNKWKRSGKGERESDMFLCVSCMRVQWYSSVDRLACTVDVEPVLSIFHTHPFFPHLPSWELTLFLPLALPFPPFGCLFMFPLPRHYGGSSVLASHFSQDY